MSELYHHGVKGQKWGVRRYQFEDGTLTMEGRRHYGYNTHSSKVKNSDGSLSEYGKRYYGYDTPIDIKEEYHKDDHIIKRGTELKRIGNAYNKGYDVNVFFSYRTDDIDEYLGVLGRMSATNQLKNFGDVSIQQITMEAQKDLRIPSSKMVRKEFADFAKENKKELLTLFNEYLKANPNKRGKYYKPMTEKDLDVDDPKKLDYAYKRFNAVLGMGTSSMHYDTMKKFQDRLAKKGYDAIADENDINVSTFKAKAPTILFNASDAVKTTSIKDVKPEDIFNAYNRQIIPKTTRMLEGSNRKYDYKNESEFYKKFRNMQLNLGNKHFNENYTQKMLAQDWAVNRFGKEGIIKINKYMNRGMTYEEAVKKYTKEHKTDKIKNTSIGQRVDKTLSRWGI